MSFAVANIDAAPVAHLKTRRAPTDPRAARGLRWAWLMAASTVLLAGQRIHAGLSAHRQGRATPAAPLVAGRVVRARVATLTTMAIISFKVHAAIFTARRLRLRATTAPLNAAGALLTHAVTEATVVGVRPDVYATPSAGFSPIGTTATTFEAPLAFIARDATRAAVRGVRVEAHALPFTKGRPGRALTGPGHARHPGRAEHPTLTATELGFKVRPTLQRRGTHFRLTTPPEPRDPQTEDQHTTPPHLSPQLESAPPHTTHATRRRNARSSSNCHPSYETQSQQSHTDCAVNARL